VTSAPVRDPPADHLLTPENSALLFIDYQPSQLAGVRSMDRALLVKNAVSTVRTIRTFGVPVLHSTVNVASGRGQPTVPELAGRLEDDKPLDRTTMNSWEDLEFVQAVHATGRRKLIMCAMWTESAWLFPPWTRCAKDTRSIPSSRPNRMRDKPWPLSAPLLPAGRPPGCVWFSRNER
jgi:hypothetical protein